MLYLLFFFGGAIFWAMIRPVFRRAIILSQVPDGYGKLIVEVVAMTGGSRAMVDITPGLLRAAPELAQHVIDKVVYGAPRCPGALCHCDDHAEPHHHMTPDR